MLLYHYSKEKYSLLKTLEKQGKVTSEERKKEEELYVKKCKTYKYLVPGYYYEHISFFFERPPIEQMSSFFGNSHDVWFNGNILYEHIIDSSKIGTFYYELVESPEKTKIYYNDTLSDKDYFNQLGKIMNDNMYIGKNNKNLELVCEKLKGTTLEYLKLLSSRPNFDEIKVKYAATIPHVMLYPILGQIKPINVNKVVIG